MPKTMFGEEEMPLSNRLLKEDVELQISIFGEEHVKEMLKNMSKPAKELRDEIREHELRLEELRAELYEVEVAENEAANGEREYGSAGNLLMPRGGFLKK